MGPTIHCPFLHGVNTIGWKDDCLHPGGVQETSPLHYGLISNMDRDLPSDYSFQILYSEHSDNITAYPIMDVTNNRTSIYAGASTRGHCTNIPSGLSASVTSACTGKLLVGHLNKRFMARIYILVSPFLRCLRSITVYNT